MKHVTLCGGSGTRSRFRLGSPKYQAVPVVKIGICANGWKRRVSLVPVRPVEGPLTEPKPGTQPARRELVFMPQSGRSMDLSSAPAKAKPTWIAAFSDILELRQANERPFLIVRLKARRRQIIVTQPHQGAVAARVKQKFDR